MDYRLWGLLIPAKSYSKKGYPFKASVDEKAAHGYPLATMDIDIWVMPSPDNAEAVLRELRCFGALLHNLTRQDLQTDGTIFQIGVAPRRIDIITAASGLRFEPTYKTSIPVNIDGIEVRIPWISDLIINKKKTGRTRDRLMPRRWQLRKIRSKKDRSWFASLRPLAFPIIWTFKRAVQPLIPSLSGGANQLKLVLPPAYSLPPSS